MSAGFSHDPQAAGLFIEREATPNWKRLNDVVGTQSAMTYKTRGKHWLKTIALRIAHNQGTSSF